MYEFLNIDHIVEELISYIDTMFVSRFQQRIVQWFVEDKNVIFSHQKIFEHNILAKYLLNENEMKS